MAKLKVASWNLETLTDGDGPRVNRVVSYLKDEIKPDVFALYEVKGKDIWRRLFQEMPQFSFFISEGVEQQHILVGVKRSRQTFVTQRDEFESGITYQRPGVLVTLHISGDNYTFLFLHTKSGDSPRAYGLRDDMLLRAFKLKKALDNVTNGNAANYVIAGDLSTMGYDVKYQSTTTRTTPSSASIC